MQANDVYRLDGQKAVVTGGSRGIGRGVALALARQGADVMVVARDQPLMDQVVAEIRQMGRQARAACVDVLNPDQIEAVMAGPVVEFGGVDIFVNNAGVTCMTRLLDTPADEIDRVIDTNLKGSIRFLQAAGRLMVKQGRGGNIIIVTSVNALWPLPSQAVYTSTKSALEALMRCMAVDMARYKVRVNSVAPGAIRTDMNKHITPEVDARMSTVIPLGHIGESDEIGDVVAFLAAPAARYITGSTILADGGLMLRK